MKPADIPFDVLYAADPPPAIAAGLAVVARDTGRVLMIQRAYGDDDPAGGLFEFPGGHIDDGETPLDGALREWAEETGLDVPAGELIGEWKAGGGKYCGYVHEIARESDVDILSGRDADANPDADGDLIEVIAWWDCEYLAADNPLLRQEIRESLDVIAKALPPAPAFSSAARSAAVAIVDLLTGGNYTPRQREARAEFLRAARRPRVPQPPLGPPVIPPPPRGKRWRDALGRYTWSLGASQAEIERVQAAFARRPSAAVPRIAAPAKKVTPAGSDAGEDMPDVFKETMAAVAARRMTRRKAIELFESQARLHRESASDVQSIGAPGEAARSRARSLAVAQRYERAIEELSSAAPTKKATPAKALAVPDLEGSDGLSSDPTVRAAQVENRIRHAYREIAAETSSYGRPVRLAEVRKRLGSDVSSREVREALARIGSENGNALTPQRLTMADPSLRPLAPVQLDGDIPIDFAWGEGGSVFVKAGPSSRLDLALKRLGGKFDRHLRAVVLTARRRDEVLAVLRAHARWREKMADPAYVAEQDRLAREESRRQITAKAEAAGAEVERYWREQFATRPTGPVLRPSPSRVRLLRDVAAGKVTLGARYATGPGHRGVSADVRRMGVAGWVDVGPIVADGPNGPPDAYGTRLAVLTDEGRRILAGADAQGAIPRAKVAPAKRTGTPVDPAVAQRLEAAREAGRAAAVKLNERDAAERAHWDAEEGRLVSAWTASAEGGEPTDFEQVGLRLLAAQVLAGSISRAEAARRAEDTSLARFAKAIRTTTHRKRPVRGRARRDQVWIVGDLEQPNAVQLVQRDDVPDGVPTYATKKEAQHQVWLETLADMERRGWIRRTEDGGVEVTEFGEAENQRLADESAAEREAKKKAIRGKIQAYDLKPGDRIMVQFDSEGNLVPEMDRFDSFPVRVVKAAVPPDFALGVVDDQGRELTTTGWDGDPTWLRRQLPRYRLETAGDVSRVGVRPRRSPPFGAAAAAGDSTVDVVAVPAQRPRGGAAIVTAGTPIDPAFEGLGSVGEVELVAAREAKRITGRDITFDYGNADPAIAAEWSSGLLRGMERFPAVRLETVRAGAISPEYAGHAESGPLLAITSADGRTITFDPLGMDAKRYRLMLEMNGFHRHLAVGSPFGLALHELGHAVAFSYRGPQDSMYEQTEGWALKYAGDAGSSLGRVAATQISRRAVAKRGELLPEAFAQVLAGQPSEMAAGIVARMDEYAARGYESAGSGGGPGAAAAIADPLGLAGRYVGTDVFEGSVRVDGRDGAFIGVLARDNEFGPVASIATVKPEAVAGWDFSDDDNSAAYIYPAQASTWAEAVDSVLSGRKREADADGEDIGDLFVRANDDGTFDVSVLAYPLRPDQEEAEYLELRSAERAELVRELGLAPDPDEDGDISPEELAQARAANLAEFDQETQDDLAQFRARRAAHTVRFTWEQAEGLRDWLRAFSARPGSSAGAAVGVRDTLRLAGRVDLDPGEVFVGSDKLDGENDGRVRIAATQVDGRPMVRLGIGTELFDGRHDPTGPWRGAPPTGVDAVNAERARLRSELDALEAIDEDQWTPAQVERVAELADMDFADDIVPEGYTARLGASDVARFQADVRAALAKAKVFDDEAIAQWAEIERLDAELEQLGAGPSYDVDRREELVEKYVAHNGHRTPDGDWFTPPTPGAPPLTPEEDAELDQLTEQLDAYYERLHDLRERRTELYDQYQVDSRGQYERSLTEGVIPGEWSDLRWRVYADEAVTLEVWNVPHGMAEPPAGKWGDEIDARFDAAGAEKLLRTLGRAVEETGPGAAYGVAPDPTAGRMLEALYPQEGLHGGTLIVDDFMVDRFTFVTTVSTGELVVSDRAQRGGEPVGDRRVVADWLDPDQAREVADLIDQMAGDAYHYVPDEPDDDEDLGGRELRLEDYDTAVERNILVGYNVDGDMVMGWARKGVDEPDPENLERDYLLWTMPWDELGSFAYTLREAAYALEDSEHDERDTVGAGEEWDIIRYADGGWAFSDDGGDSNAFDGTFPLLQRLREELAKIHDAGKDQPGNASTWKYIGHTYTIDDNGNVTISDNTRRYEDGTHVEITFGAGTLNDVIAAMDQVLADAERDGRGQYMQPEEAR